MNIDSLPALNAFLNVMATLFILLGWYSIKGGMKERHKKFMIAALSCSALFLTSYLIYHYNAELMTPFKGEGVVRVLYYFILFTHIPLAILVLPFIIAVVWRAYKGEFEKHKKIARRVVPVWLYVSVTGVLIYLMLYQLPV